MNYLCDLRVIYLIRFCLVDVDIVVDNCAICRNHIMDLCEFDLFYCTPYIVIPVRFFIFIVWRIIFALHFLIN